MAKQAQKLTPHRGTDRQTAEDFFESNVRRIDRGAPIAELADDITRCGLLSSLNVGPILDEAAKTRACLKFRPAATGFARSACS